jgi:NAD+--dinitrogen-reductase ADP-D-ribosyltransferase
LDEIPGAEERSRLFHDYVIVKFGLNEKVERQGKTKSIYSYVNLLSAWGADSNRQAGAVLKAWVESRFGILATYHNGRLADDAAARNAFMLDRMHGSAKSTGVLMQLDLLYTFCQDELRRRFPGTHSKTLYRGTHDPEEYIIRSQGSQTGSAARRITLVQLNNLSSFSSDPEVAWEFGSNAWEVEVPLAKIVFFSGLLPKSLLSGESEYLVLGGYYNVRTLVC